MTDAPKTDRTPGDVLREMAARAALRAAQPPLMARGARR